MCGVVAAILGVAPVADGRDEFSFVHTATNSVGSAASHGAKGVVRVTINAGPFGGQARYIQANGTESVAYNGSWTEFTDYFSWSGNTSTNQQPVQGTSGGIITEFRFRKNTSSAWQTVPINIPPGVCRVSHSSSNGSVKTQTLPPITITLDASGFATIDNPHEELPEETERRGEVRLLLENNTGEEQEIDWLGQKLKLKPGMNEFRYDGKVDAQGRPLQLPEGFEGTPFGGNGGVPNYLHGSFDSVTHESGEFDKPLAQWTTPAIGTPAPQVLGLGDGKTRGNTILFPGVGGTSGSIITLPVTKPPQPPKDQPAGTGGSGISDPSKPTPAPPAPGGGDTTNNITNSVTTNNTFIQEGEGNGPGADNTGDLSNMEKDATDKAELLKKDIEASTQKAYGFWDFQFWMGPSSLSGTDNTMLSWTLPIDQQLVTIEIKPEWISVMRGILLWVIKIGFVMAVLKLVMR